MEQIIFPRFPRKGSGSFIQASAEAFEKQTHFATDSTWYQLWTDTSVQAVEHEVLCAAVDAPWGVQRALLPSWCTETFWAASSLFTCWPGGFFRVFCLVLGFVFFFLLYLLITATGFTSKTSFMCLGYMCFICSSEQGNCGTVGVVVVIVIIIIMIMIKKYICLGESYLFMFIFTLKDRWDFRLQNTTQTMATWVLQWHLFLEIHSQLRYRAEGAC